MTKLSESDVCRAYAMRQSKVSMTTIARTFNVSKSTIYRRLAIFENENRLGAKKRDRVNKLGLRDMNRIKEYVGSNPFATNAEILTKLALPIGQATLARYCKKLNLTKYRSPKKFYVSPEHCEERVSVANIRLNWTQSQWKRVVFCDEAGVDNSGMHLKTVRRPKGQRYNSDFVYRHPNKSLRINYFSWVSAYGVGELIVYKRMDAKYLCTEVIPHMVESLKSTFNSDDFLIVHDNASFFAGPRAVSYLTRNGCGRYFLSIPPYSPEMNIIENLWAYLRYNVKRDCFLYGRIDRRTEFIETVKNIWDNIPNSMIQHLYESLPRRMEAIVRKQGLSIKY